VERIDPQALKALQAYKWPGNIRELEHVVEYGLSMAEGDTIKITDLPEEFLNRVADGRRARKLGQRPFQQGERRIRKIYITQLLKESDWNISEASRKARCSARTAAEDPQIRD